MPKSWRIGWFVRGARRPLIGQPVIALTAAFAGPGFSHDRPPSDASGCVQALQWPASGRDPRRRPGPGAMERGLENLRDFAGRSRRVAESGPKPGPPRIGRCRSIRKAASDGPESRRQRPPPFGRRAWCEFGGLGIVRTWPASRSVAPRYARCRRCVRPCYGPIAHEIRERGPIRSHQRGRDADPELADGSRTQSACGFEVSFSLEVRV